MTREETNQTKMTVRDFRGMRLMRNSPLLAEAWRYWTSLRQGSDLPRRSALDPAAMKTILGHAMILDRIQHGTIRVRLGGPALRQMVGMDVRGLPIRAFFDLADRSRAVDLIADVFDVPASLELDLISDGPDGIVTARMLVLPLLDAAGAPTKALAVTVTDRPVTEASRRFSLTNATRVPLGAGRFDAPSRRRPENLPEYRPDEGRRDPLSRESLPREVVAGMAEAPAPFEAAPTQVPWLRVVK